MPVQRIYLSHFRFTSLAVFAVFLSQVASAEDTPLLWNPWDKESPEPYGYDVYTEPDLPLGYVDPNDPPATLDRTPLEPSRAVLSVETAVDRTSYSWFGDVTVTAEVRREGILVSDCDSVLVASAANPRVQARLVDDGTGSDATAADGIYSGVFAIGAGEGESRPTGTYNLTATAYRASELGEGTSPSFSIYSVRRWTGITTTNLPDQSDAYTAFAVELNGDETSFHHTIRDLGLIRSTSVSNAQIRIPVFPVTNEISQLSVTGAGVSNVSLEGNVIAFDCNLTGSNVTRVTIEFDSPSDLAATRIDRYQTGDIGLRNFRNGYLVWNRYYHTAILGSSFTTPHGPGCIVDHHVTDLTTGVPHTIDCMERVAVHLDNSARNDGTGTYPSNIKWDDDALSWMQSGNLDSILFRFESGGNYGRQDDVFVERHVEFYAGTRSFRHHYRIENVDAVSHDFDFVWGREQWLYGEGGSNRQNGDRGILPNDAMNYGGEFRFVPGPAEGNWFAAFDLSSFYSIGVLTPDDSADELPSYVHLLCNPAISANATGEYPISPAGSCSNMENLFFEKQIGVLEPGESASYEFYQWGGYGENRADLDAILWDDANAILPDPASADDITEDQIPGPQVRSTGLILRPIIPNPISDQSEIMFTLPDRLPTSLTVFDVRGRVRAELIDDVLPAGLHATNWPGKDEHGSPLPSGVYFVRLAAGGQSEIQKITIGQR